MPDFPDIHYIATSKSSNTAMTKTYRIETPIVNFGHSDFYDIFRIEQLFRDGENRTATTGQPVGHIGRADDRYTHLKGSDVSITQTASRDKPHWIFKAVLSYVPLSTPINDNNLLGERPWEKDAVWSSTKGSAERFKFKDADGKPLVMSNGQPFVSPVSLDHVIVYTVGFSTLVSPWSDQEDLLNAVNDASYNLSGPNITVPKEALWCTSFDITEEDFIEENTSTQYYSVTVSLARIIGDTWVDFIMDMINYQKKADANDNWIDKPLINPADKSRLSGPYPGNGAGLQIDYNADNIGIGDGPGGAAPVNVPLSPVSDGISQQRVASFLQHWFKRRTRFFGIGGLDE